MQTKSKVVSYLGLGSNIGEPRTNLQQAVEYLRRLRRSQLLAISSVYKTPPLGGMQQPDYFNIVVALQTDLPPLQLMASLQTIEDIMLRDRHTARWSERIIDIDIILYGNGQIDSLDLQVPHSGMRERSFVLYPLLEIAPQLILPTGEKLQEVWHNSALEVPQILTTQEWMHGTQSTVCGII